MDYRFGSKELEKCLACLGFAGRKAIASHKKYTTPAEKKVSLHTRPFIVVILGKKSYANQTVSKYIKDIINLGFSEEEIQKCL